MPFTSNDKQVLRHLAAQYMEIAQLPKQQETVRLWKALNRGKMERPMVAMDQLPWHELNGSGELTCQVSDPTWRKVERTLRETIYRWKHFPVDMVVEPFITIPKAISDTGYGISILQETAETDATNDIRAQHYESQIQEMGDELKIKDAVVTHDEATSKLWLQEAEDIFEGVAPVRQCAGFQHHLGVWDFLTQIMGAEEVYYNFIDQPELLHAAMERLTQSKIAAIEQGNALGLHNDIINTCHCSYTYTDDLLPEPGQGKGPYSKNSWAFGLAQVFTAVSPEQYAEFEIPYIQRMASYFGAVYYGCCERLDDRLEYVKQIPNVRKVSCSPWSNREKFAENIGTELVMSNKPTPALVATDSFDPAAVRADLQRTYDAAKENGVNLEFILKDVSTVRYDPSRLEQWAEIAMDVVSK